jgi:Spy/CpxP family protein refolding chaperone
MRLARVLSLALVLVVGIASGGVAGALEPPTPPPSPGDDPVGRNLFAPDRVMGHAQEIGLDDAQRTAIRADIQKTSPKFTDLQLDLQAEMEKLSHLLAEKRVDEAKALGQLDKILALEREIKRAQIGLLVRIKNTLSPQQQDKLTEIAKSGR